jgi:PKD repeat protein
MFFVSVAFGLLVLFLASPVPAFQGFDDGGGGGLPGCATCHGTLANRGSGHDAHAALTNTCSDCHGSGAFNDPPLDNCVQCHGRDEDAGGDSESLGIGRGLRLHHVTTNAASCGSCHSDALGAAGVGENVLPSFYTAALGGAGLDSCDGSEERFTSLTVSLDNDGDGLADGNDPDCVANVAPVANAGGPYSGVVGSMIGFDGTASSDADGTIASYSWDFGDGGVASGPSPTHSYSVDGSFTVTLTVTDNDGLTGTDSTSAVINPAGGNTPPVAQANGPYSGTEGSAVQFSSNGSLDPDGSIVTYAWDFGDGSMSATANPSHTYVAAGTYNVSLTVTDDAGDSTSDATTATIEANFVNEPPTADANGPYAGFVGDTVVFDGSASTDADGAVVRYDWDFGDGIVAADAGPVPTHVYAAAGQFTVTLTVTDDLGATGSNSSSVTIAGRDAASDGETQYNSYCASCHGDPWVAPAVDSALTGAHRVTGARACSIEASIFGTYVFQDGAPGMQFLQGLANDGSVDAEQLAEYLNSQTVTGEQRYVTACAGCHGDDGSGGRTREGVLGESAYEIREAIREEGSMRFLACLPDSDIDSIAAFLGGNAGATDSDDDDSERDGGGGSGDFPFLLMLVAFGLSRMMGHRNGVRS